MKSARQILVIAVLVVAASVTGCASTTTPIEPESSRAGAAGGVAFNLEDDVPGTDTMTHEQIDAILRAEAKELERKGPVWLFEYRGVVMVVMADDDHDRMRIVAPIVPVAELPDARVLLVLMEANFHTAQDARYATSDGVVYSAYSHPLSSLTDEDFRSALSQVSNLVLTFGTTFSGQHEGTVDVSLEF